MAEKLQSKVKLRSGEVVTIDHVKPSKSTPADSKTKSETKTSETDQTKVAPKETK
jgi:hypothetical protein